MSNSNHEKSWLQQIEQLCEKYNISLEYLPAILRDAKVLPMIRGKSFEFSALAKFLQILDPQEWDVAKLNLNPQFGIHDEDVSIKHFKTNKIIRIECKLAAKGKYRKISDNFFQIDIKCMRSRTLGDKKIKELAPLIGVSEQILKIHNDQYIIKNFDIVVTSIANAFYNTVPETNSYEWEPNADAVNFLQTLNKDNSLDLSDKIIQKNFAFEKVYVALSKNLAATQLNSIICSRKKCKTYCGFIPNYPKITFDLSTGKPLKPWFEIEECLDLLSELISG